MYRKLFRRLKEGLFDVDDLEREDKVARINWKKTTQQEIAEASNVD